MPLTPIDPDTLATSAPAGSSSGSPVLTTTLPADGLHFIDPLPVTIERFFRAVFP